MITYLLTIMSASEVTKPARQHESISCRIELSCTEPWDMVKAQFLNEISDALSPLKFTLITMSFHSRFPELYLSLYNLFLVATMNFWYGRV
jgi:hypothetical protein